MTDYTQLITSEHNQQPKFNAYVALLANPLSDIAALIDSLPALFDLDVAVGAQLDATGAWIGQARQVANVLTPGFFGFSDDISALGFGEIGQPSVGGRFIELGEQTSGSAILSDPEYRNLLRARILQNQWNGTVTTFEQALAAIVNINNTGVVIPTQVLDVGSRVVSILTPQQIDPVAYALLTGYDIVPRPAGIRYQFMQPLSTPYPWTVAGTATASGTTVRKPTGVAAWDSSAFIAQPSPALYVSWTVPNNSNALMGGIASNPSGSPNYPTLNYAIYNQSNTMQIFESGTNRLGTFGSISAGDRFAVLLDRKQVTYWQNNKLLYTSLVAPSGSYSPMFVLNNVGAEADNVFVAAGN